MLIIVLIFFWLLFGITHSWLATHKIKARTSKIALFSKNQRLAYNVIALLQLLPIAYIHLVFDSVPILTFNLIFPVIGTIFLISGMAIVYFAFKNYSFLEFAGFRDSRNDSILSLSGLNKLVRHPLYTGTMSATLGLFLLNPDFLMMISSTCIFIYIFIGTHFEEKKLIRDFGESYLSYKNQVPRFIPRPRDLQKYLIS